MVFIHFELFK
jgi:hypothetical protein